MCLLDLDSLHRILEKNLCPITLEYHRLNDPRNSETDMDWITKIAKNPKIGVADEKNEKSHIIIFVHSIFQMQLV